MQLVNVFVGLVLAIQWNSHKRRESKVQLTHIIQVVADELRLNRLIVVMVEVVIRNIQREVLNMLRKYLVYHLVLEESEVVAIAVLLFLHQL